MKIEKGQVYQLRDGAEPFRLPGREEYLTLAVVAGFGKEPLLLLTNLLRVRDSQRLWWIVQIHPTRWNIEETVLTQSCPYSNLDTLQISRLPCLAIAKGDVS